MQYGVSTLSTVRVYHGNPFESIIHIVRIKYYLLILLIILLFYSRFSTNNIKKNVIFNVIVSEFLTRRNTNNACRTMRQLTCVFEKFKPFPINNTFIKIFYWNIKHVNEGIFLNDICDQL